MRRVNQSIFLMTTGAREASFRSVKTIAECLADELINAAKVRSAVVLLWTQQERGLLNHRPREYATSRTVGVALYHRWSPQLCGGRAGDIQADENDCCVDASDPQFASKYSLSHFYRGLTPHPDMRLQGSSNSYAIKKKDELERVAKANR